MHEAGSMARTMQPPTQADHPRVSNQPINRMLHHSEAHRHHPFLKARTPCGANIPPDVRQSAHDLFSGLVSISLRIAWCAASSFGSLSRDAMVTSRAD